MVEGTGENKQLIFIFLFLDGLVVFPNFFNCTMLEGCDYGPGNKVSTRVIRR